MEEDLPITKFTPPMLSHAHAGTPSTRYTDSPFSHVPTPSSASSYASGVLASSITGSQPRAGSPTRSRSATSNKVATALSHAQKAPPSVREYPTSSSNTTAQATQSQAGCVRQNAPVQMPLTFAARAKIASDVSRTAKQQPMPGGIVRSNPSAGKCGVVVPPELAHLNVEPTMRPSLDKPLPPRRPSRDDTPNLTSLTGPSPIVQSDLPRLYTTYHKRTPSQETPVSAASPSLRSRFGWSPRSSSKQGSPRVDSAISQSPVAHKQVRGQTPESIRSVRPKLLRKDSPAITPTSSPSQNKSGRFGFLSRKSKNENMKGTEKPKREPRKGPAAGTGYEGYGRFGLRGRSGSVSSSAFGRSPSADSNASSVTRPTPSRKTSTGSEDSSGLDDFLKERLNPVVLRGSGSTFSTQATNPLVSVRDSSSSPSLDNVAPPRLLPSAMDGDRVATSAKRIPSGYQESLANSGPSQHPTLAVRRSNICLGNATMSARVPPPIDTNVPAKRDNADNSEVETAWPQTDGTLPPEPAEAPVGKEGLWLRPKKASPAPPKKWNLFQRAKPSQHERNVKSDDNEYALQTSHDEMTRGEVSLHPMLGSVEPVNLDEIERLLGQRNNSVSDSMSEYSSQPPSSTTQSLRRSKLSSTMLDSHIENPNVLAQPRPPRIMVRHGSSESPELLRAQTALPAQMAQVVDIPRSPLSATTDKVTSLLSRNDDIIRTPELVQEPISTPEIAQGTDSPRLPRLSPVGRIPRVVSTRDRDRRLPNNSFSRPFATTHPRPSVRPPGSLYNQIRDLASPVDASSQPVSSTSGRSDSISADKSRSSSDQPTASTNRTSMDFYAGNEFITFTPRKNSSISYSSSSGYGSWIATAPVHVLQDEDVWHEYNDLMNEVMPEKTPISAGSSLGVPFQYAHMLQDGTSPAMPPPLSFGKPPTQQPSAALPQPPRLQTEPAVLSVPQQIARLMQPSLSPLTPDTLSQFVSTYGDRNTNSIVSQNRQSMPQTNRSSMPRHRNSLSSSRYSMASMHSRSASLPEANARNSRVLSTGARFSRDTQLLDIAESQTDEQASMANLRLGALMTSKWLSFGRVLFSPAHNEMHLSADPRILVVDGLGDDWSHYVALSYPEAAVYNLGPSEADGVARSGEWGNLPNHRHWNHSSVSTPFPFPKGFFTAVVFRFPAATTEQAYQGCIAECKRVLRPGGHLEVAVLDIDLINMGTRGRRAIRGLKTRMQNKDPHVSLRNMSDVLVRMIGRRGFEQVQRCVVGVPAAGRIARSQDMSISSGSSDCSRHNSWRQKEHDDIDKNFHFADLLQDARSSQVDPGRTNDEGITKMVAKVGRWWYSACYEKSLLKTDKSIWSEPGLLRECEKQATSFKMLICYAQKPAQTRRRTASV